MRYYFIKKKKVMRYYLNIIVLIEMILLICIIYLSKKMCIYSVCVFLIDCEIKMLNNIDYSFFVLIFILLLVEY